MFSDSTGQPDQSVKPTARYAKARKLAPSEAKSAYDALVKKRSVYKLKARRRTRTGRLSDTIFPPKPLTLKAAHRIITVHCKTVSPRAFREGGCAVCGNLIPLSMLTALDKYEGSLRLLIRSGVTRKERFKSTDPIEDLEGPVLAEGCTHICVDCETSLNSVVPRTALVRHNWIGTVPTQLQDLTYAERIMIARVRHNRCVVRVNSGRVRMSANAIMFSQPVLSIFNAPPPSKKDMNEVLAFVFMGSAAPTQQDFDRTPMLVRKKKVVEALEWLKLNHEGYTDLEISQENLDSYEDRGIPVVVDYRRTTEDIADAVPAGTTAVFESSNEYGTKWGKCVHGLTGTEYATATMQTIKLVALQHLTNQGNMLGIGGSELPVSMYDNVSAYPGMFPWLFPYGKGGIGHPSHSKKTSEVLRKKNLLMYHDKRFQVDDYFPMIAFNHKQLKAASTGSILLARRSKFVAVARRLSAVNYLVAGNIVDRMVAGDHVRPTNTAEQICFDLIKDLDGVAGRVQGSITSKKYMRNEIWSTIAFFNAPTWFVTISWSDLHHPLALYYAQTDTIYRPEIKTSKEKNDLAK
ncbi:hypothetical protein B0H14DRAFT_2356817 [Mycena olivaceomarginata]|nr:hypothetical protein B0H14DRAFT_2356817 [Mycena olivaceomarginata]